VAATSFDHAFPHARLLVVGGRLVKRFGRGQVQLLYPRAESLFEFIDAPDQPGNILVPPRAIIEVSLALKWNPNPDKLDKIIVLDRLANLSLNLCPMRFLAMAR
jgi:hypothetical protein